MSLWKVAVLVFVINLPFGYWRASMKKFSPRWFLAALLPVLLVIALTIFSVMHWKPLSLPVLVAVFILGQFVGGRVRLLISGRGPR
ncbi:MAG: hypothetical protein QOE46_1860 [Acidobacteriota bacterium]|jgi:hypothetical protein|nr:hypothetical protein [Acidobacteriota bacterium]